MPTNQIPITSSVAGDIVDADTDLRVIEVPDATNATLVKVAVTSMRPAVGTPTIEVRNTIAGGGSGITVTFVDGEYEAEATGSITLIDYLFIRSGTVGDLSNINIIPYIVWSA